MGESNGTAEKKPNVMAIGALVAALGVGGSGIGIIGNQSATDEAISELRAEVAAMKVLLADEEKRMISLVQETDKEAAARFRRGRDDQDQDIKELESKVHVIELDLVRSGHELE